MNRTAPGLPVHHQLRSPSKLMSIKSMMPSNHLILCCPLLLPSIFPSIRVFSNESAFSMRWPKYWSFSFNISPSNEHPGLISFRMDWLDLLAVQGTLKSLLWETSTSGTTAIATLDSAGPRNWTRQQKLTPGPSVPESQLPSLCRPPSEPDMLEHLSSLPTQMDYKGQKLAEQMFQGIILSSAIVGFIYGHLAEQFGWTVYIVMAGFAFSCLLTLPPWPIYRRHPFKWLPVQDSSTEDKKPGERKVKRHAKNN